MAPQLFKSIVRFLQLSCPKLSMLLGLWEEALSLEPQTWVTQSSVSLIYLGRLSSIQGGNHAI